MSETQILTPEQWKQKIDRIAHQIHENYFDEDELVIIGVANRGHQLAEKLAALLTDIAEFKIELGSIRLDKDAPLSVTPEMSLEKEQYAGKPVVLVDDVLNSGKTLVYALGHILTGNPKTIKTVTLVDRRHRKFPIKADYVGMTLSTTLQEHISVRFNDGSTSVVLK